MAHIVTCVYCKTKFDRDKYPFIKVSERRYAHKECSEKATKEAKEEEKNKQDLIAYISKLYKGAVNWPLVNKQIKTYKENYNYSYSGMLKSLIYVYEIKKGDISKAKGVGVIPIYYKDAFNYYYAIWEANQKNKDKKLEDFVSEEKVIKILSPQRKIKKAKLFAFLDEEE